MDIPIINDNFLEPDETFQLQISVPKAAVRAGVLDVSDAIVTLIIENDGKLYIKFTMLTASRGKPENVCMHEG